MSDDEVVNKGITVIIIDDDDLMRRAVRAALSSLNCQVVGETFDGEDGLRLYEDGLRLYNELKPDLVLLDIRMPKMDGLEVLQKLSEANEDPYVVMMTFIDDEDSVQDCMIAGAKDYLRKDMSLKEMVARLERHVTRLSKAV